MAIDVRFALSFEGEAADNHMLDFYDAAEALGGFQRSLALTMHLILNGEIITQAPALEGAEILIKSPEPGSWKVVAIVSLIMSGVNTLGTASRDSVFGHLATSLYDYVVSETLGFHVDFDQTIGQQYEELQRSRRAIAPPISQSQADSLIEKTESSIRGMHRPIFASQTATSADISAKFRRQVTEIATLNGSTYDYVNYTNLIERPVTVIGRVSSYNINTFRGRVYIPAEKRPIPFELSEMARDLGSVVKITSSLDANARDRMRGAGDIVCTAFRFESNTGRLKRLVITKVD